MSAFLFSFFVICLIRLNFQQNQLYKEEFQYMEKNTSFTEGKIMQPLLLFAVPVLLALFLQAMYGAVDLLIVGKFASSADVSAVSTGSQIMTTPYHNSPAYKMLFLCFHGPSADFPAATWSSLQPPPVSYRKTPVHCTVFSFHHFFRIFLTKFIKHILDTGRNPTDAKTLHDNRIVMFENYRKKHRLNTRD